MAETVLVTGASGFIALHCIQQLLAAGYNVHGTVRSLKREPEVRGAMANVAADADDRLSFRVADLTSDAGWDDAMEGCDYLLHVASPFPSRPPKHEDDLIVPARDGALRALKAAARSGVKRAVMTSSMAAIAYGHKYDPDRVFDENDWSDLKGKGVGAYEKSKTIAERAAWDFIASPEANGLQLATVNPGLVLGPILTKDASTSVEVIRQIMSRAMPAIPRIGFTCVDVRDVASAHVSAMTHPEAAGLRFACGAECVWMRDVALILDKHFAERGYKIPTAALPDFVPRVMSIFNPSLRLVTANLGERRNMSNKRLKDMFGWAPRGVEEMTVASGESLIGFGVV